MRRPPLDLRVPAAALGFAAAAVAVPAPALAAPPAPVAAFDLNATYTASRGAATMGDSGGGNGWGTDAGRRFRSVRQYSGVQLNAAAPASYTLVALVRMTTVSGKRRLIDFSSGRSDDGIYVRDGRLVVVRGGADVAASSGAVVPAGTWRQVVVTRDAAGTLTAYVEGAPVLTYADTTGLATGSTIRLFRDDWYDGSAGGVKRVRLYGAPLAAEDVVALQDDKLDATAPAVSVDDAGGLVGARPRVSGVVADAGSAPERITAKVEVLDADGSVLGSASAHADADGRWTVAYPDSAPALRHGAGTTLRVTATDAAGNAATTTSAATVDAEGPVVALTAPGTFAGARPGVAGRTADASSGARVTVAVDVLDGAGGIVATGPAQVAGDGTFTFTYPADAPTLAEGGTYTFRATATDHLGNRASTSADALSDGVAPQGLVLESPSSDATIPQPFVGGAAATGPRDEGAVSVTVLHGGAPVATFGVPVERGRFSARVPVALGEGHYTAVVRQCDTAGNCAESTRAFAVTSLPAIDGWEVRSPITAAGSVSAQSAARRLLAAAKAELTTLGARRLAKRTTLKLTSPIAGTVSLRLYTGTAKASGARKKSAKLLAGGRRSFAQPGTARLTVAATKTGRSRLRRGAKLPVTLRVVVTPKGGKAVTLDGPLTLKGR